MQNVAPVHDRTGRDKRLRLAFLTAVISVVASFVASAAPIPLFNIYRAEDGFTNADISVAVAANSLGTIAALLVLGRLSNHLGRRFTGFASLGLLLLGCLLLLNVHDIGTLLASRLVMGVGTGLASSGLTAYIVDTSPSRPAWLASVASSQTPMLGLTLGAVASGVLVEVGPWPRELIYVVCAVLLVLSAILLAISPETVTRAPGAWRSLRPRVGVPARGRHLLPVAVTVFVATWATGAFYQAFVPALVQDQMQTRSPLVLGLVFAAYLAAGVVGSPLGSRFSSAMAQRVGMVVFLTGWVGIILGITTGALPLFIVGTAIAGSGQGISISGAVRGLLYGSTVADRAPIFSTVYLACYSGAAFPSLIAGQFSHIFSVPQIALGYAGLALVATLFTLVGARNPHLSASSLGGQQNEAA